MAIPRPKVFWPFTFDATNNKINYRITGDVADRTATISPTTITRASQIGNAVSSALNAAGGGPWTVTVDNSTGLVTLSTGTGFTLKFGTGANAATSPRSFLGFFAQDYNSVGNSLTAPRQHLNGWYSPVAVRRDSKEYSEDDNSVMTVAASGQNKNINQPRLICRELEFAFLPDYAARIEDDFAATVDGRRAIENWWVNGRARFTYWPDQTDDITYREYFFDVSALEKFRPVRTVDAKAIYSVGPWKLRRYV